MRVHGASVELELPIDSVSPPSRYKLRMSVHISAATVKSSRNNGAIGLFGTLR